MSEAMEYIEYLSREIGPRPAGTEEEQQAALYITERLQNDTEFPATIEDFTGSSNLEGLTMLCSLVAVVVTILAMIFPIVSIPAFILTVAAAAIYALETYGKRPISHALARGASQNVVAKYQPGNSPETGRRRKVVLVSHYDTGKVMPPLVRKIESFGLPLGPICLGGFCLTALLMLFRVVAFSGSGGVGVIVFNIITILALIVTALPGVRGILYRVAPYNEGANNNASGVAAVMEIARRISFGSASEADLAARAEGVTIHGAGAAYGQNLIPEGAQLVYEASQLQPPNVELMTPEDRLAAAKAAIAAFTGQPLPRRATTDIAGKLVGSRAVVTMDGGQVAPYTGYEEAPAGASAYPAQSVMPDEGPAASDEEAPAPAVTQDPTRASAYVLPLDASAQADEEEGATPAETPAGEVAVSAETPVVEPAASAELDVEEPEPEPELVATFDNMPDWFAAAQRKAKRTAPEDSGVVQRSRYAEAMDAAERERAIRREEQQRAAEEAAAAAAAESVQKALAAEQASWELPAEPAPLAAQAPWEQPVEDALVSEEANYAEYDAKPQVKAKQLKVDYEAEALEAEAEAYQEQPEAAITSPFALPLDESNGADDVHRRPVVRPTLEGEATQGVRAVEATKQRAPLADAATDSQQGARSLLTMLPSVEEQAEPLPPRSDGMTHSGSMRRLRADLPSLSGAIMPKDGEPAEEHYSSISTVGSFGAAGGTGAFAPLGDELIEDMDPEDIYVDDADDSDIEENFTETGAYAGPDYVEMPKSRIARFFDRFRKHDKDMEQTPQEWLDVDEGFDPRTVGRERGGWESFREEQEPELAPAEGEPAEYDDYDDYGEYDDYDEYDDFGEEEEPAPRGGRRWEGGGFSRMRLGHVDMRSGEGADEPVVVEGTSEEVREQPADELDSILHFRNPDFATEIWFVALGSEQGFHDGIEAFMDAHRNELRGAMIIDVEALGAGELSVIQEEGRYRRVKTSSRLKRYVQKTSASTGITPGIVSLKYTDSSASIALKGGMQAVHLAGIENGMPAYSGGSDDVLENIDEDTLEANIDYLLELVRHF